MQSVKLRTSGWVEQQISEQKISEKKICKLKYGRKDEKYRKEHK